MKCQYRFIRICEDKQIIKVYSAHCGEDMKQGKL